MRSPPSRLVLVVALLLLGPLSWTMRELDHRRLTLVGNAGWVTSDPDTFYQVRRVERALEEGAVAGSDAYLNHPEGSPIPWPPYYTRLLSLALAPFAPERTSPGADGGPGEAAGAGARRAWVEMRVASAARLFGVLTTLLAACAGWRIAGGFGAFAAGGYHAVCAASIAYSKSGNGDHHAWVALLFGAVLVLLALGLEQGALERRAPGWRTGIAAGALTGVLLGSWVGALLYVIAVDLICAWLLFLNRAPRPLQGLAPLGLGFHLTAAAVVFPAVSASPWNAVNPWMVINLTWFHELFLLAGAAVFAPLALLAPEVAARRRYPWLVAAALGLVLALAALLDAPPARGVREGFAWVSRMDAFMARVDESRPLVGSGRYGELFRFLGFGVLVLPFAWLALARGALRGRLGLIPWAVCVPFLALQAARQGRFADALVLPLGVALACAGGTLLRGRAGPVPAALGLLLALTLNPDSTSTAWRRYREGAQPATKRERPSDLGARYAADWLRLQRPRAGGPNAADQGVLAPWSLGHLIEWAADRPTIATNFGSYVGEDGFKEPARFFMSEDPEQARALLERRQVGWVLVPSNLPNMLNLMVETAVPERRAEYVRGPDAAGRYSPNPPWFRTLGARLMFDGEVFYPMGPPPEAPPWQPLDFLRLVFVSPLPDLERRLRSPTDVSPAAWLWERVEGAVLEARGAPGTRLEVSIGVRFPKAKRRLTWTSTALAGTDGIARLRVPYATDVPNGDGWVAPDAATWSFGQEQGELAVPESAITAGATVPLN